MSSKLPIELRGGGVADVQIREKARHRLLHVRRAVIPEEMRSTVALGWAIAIFVSVAAFPRSSLAERQHTVQSGQTLARIAHHYSVTVASLAAANRLGRESMLRPGQVLRVPERGVVYVRSGQTLAGIARRYDLSVEALARQNHLKPGSVLRIGQRVLLPGYEAARERERAARRWGRPRRPGVAKLYRVASGEKRRIRLVDRFGRVRRPALRRLRHLLRPKRARQRKAPHPRLVRLMAQVSDHFGGRPLSIISGYRRPGGSTSPSSRHVKAQAVDFRVQGVPLEAVRDYCRTFDHVGVGYYPRSHFIHLDVRRANAYWVDWSKPGQPPMLRKPADLRENAEAKPTDDAQVDGERSQPPAADDGQPPIDDAPEAIVD